MRGTDIIASLRTAVIIPCFNEGMAIGKVVKDFKAALPQADIYVYDNNSSDSTRQTARAAGAIVRTEPQQGKGHVVRRMFSDVDADIYVLADGDNTYDASAAPKMIAKLAVESLDMVTGCRVERSEDAYRFGHRFGNQALTGLVATIFGARTRDMLSGYRIFSRRFVKSFPALSRGFEIETEFTVHALELRMPIADMDTNYHERLPGSVSKLNTVRDGVRILQTIIRLVKEERPFTFFGATASALAIISLGLFAPVLFEYFETGLVPRFPTVILASAIMLAATLALTSGFILDSVAYGRREAKRIAYLGHQSVGALLQERLRTNHIAPSSIETRKTA